MPVLSERHGRVLLVRLDRDAKLNAMDRDMTLGLDAAMNLLDDDPGLWAGVLTGNGRAFSAGSDLADPDRNNTERGGPYGLIGRERRKPLVAAVDGLAFGGGFEMVLACDLVVASRRARFALPEVKRGLLALYGGVFRAARALPLNLAREMVLTGEPVDAERAHALGLVNRLCEAGDAVDQALALAASICANSPVAVRQSLRVLNQSLDAGDALAWQLSAEAAATVRASADSREGIAAFLEKRAPVWPAR
jgi:enoyl-CoA hydratase/carnithine racemase